MKSLSLSIFITILLAMAPLCALASENAKISSTDLSDVVHSDNRMKDLFLNACESSVSNMSEKKIFRLSEKCFDLMSENRNNVFKKTETGNLVGTKNAILIKENGKSLIKIISGSNTGISQIVSLDSSKNGIVALNGNKEILVFKGTIEGDVKPTKTIPLTREAKADKVFIKDNTVRVMDANGGFIDEFDF